MVKRYKNHSSLRNPCFAEIVYLDSGEVQLQLHRCEELTGCGIPNAGS
jgi:hypothetical protein